MTWNEQQHVEELEQDHKGHPCLAELCEGSCETCPFSLSDYEEIQKQNEDV
jgi:hypothetical protein